MFADLKEKAAGMDKKRVYTAVAALVIAGAAGHFMQRSAGGSGAERVIASVPAAAPIAPIPAAAPQTASVPERRAAAEPAPAETDAAPASVPNLSALAAVANIETALLPAPAPAVPAPAELAEAEPPASVAPERDAPEDTIFVADLAAAAPDIPVAPAEEDVTRADTTTAFAMLDAEPAPDTPQEAMEMTVASAEGADELFQDEPLAATPDCAFSLDASAKPAALVEVNFTAPCNPGEDVIVEQAGLKFSEQLGPLGDLYILVPAMTEDAIVTVTLDNGQQTSSEVYLPDFAQYARIALIWKGATGLQIDALENGATYGEPGHIWAQQPASPDAATSGEGGFVTVLGSTADGYAADVYTYPASLMNSGVAPDVSIEAQVEENTCDSQIDGSVLRSNLGRSPSIEALSISAPGCDAVGQYLVLKNLPQDLKLARN